MSEYIKRSDAASKQFRYLLPNGKMSLPVVFVKDIERLPAANVIERKSGEWIEHGEPNEYGAYQPWYWTCSNCGAVGYHEFNFCSNCGADMRNGGDKA